MSFCAKHLAVNYADKIKQAGLIDEKGIIVSARIMMKRNVAEATSNKLILPELTTRNKFNCGDYLVSLSGAKIEHN